MPSSYFAEASAVSNDKEYIIADVCDDYFARLDRGEFPVLEDYIRQYPDLSQEIRGAVQALMLIHASGDPSGSGVKAALLRPEIPGFVIGSEIGRGGVGVVYDAKQIKDNRRVAIKILKPQGHTSSTIRERFLREAEVSSRLDHPNIVRCFGSGCVGEDAYMTMEFIDGHNFNQVFECLVKGKESEQTDVSLRKAASELADYRKLAEFGADVASALSFAHGQRVIHRDIKPANLLVDKNGRAWVADFGLAKIFHDDDNLSRTGDMIGTPRYMSPEQVRGVCSTHSDIYSLGVTLYEFAARKRAWESVAKNQLLTARVSMELPDLMEANPDVPPGLAKIIRKACAFDPTDRYESARELETVLRRFAAGKQNADRRNRERMEDDHFVRRKSILTTVGLIAGVTTAAVIMAIGGQEQEPVPDTPAKIISVLSDKKVLNQAMEALPASPGNDTFRKKVTRHATAAKAEVLVDQTLDEFVEDRSDRQWIKETSAEIADAYKKGDISRGDAKSFIDGATGFVSMMRIQNAMRQIHHSQWSESEKTLGIAVCQELLMATTSGVMSKDTSSQVKQFMPGRSEVGRQLDRSLRKFVREAWTALRSLTDVPTGSPNGPERRQYYEAVHRQKYQAAKQSVRNK